MTDEVRSKSPIDDGRRPELDGIRGMAILLVLVWHYAAIQIQTQPGSLSAYGMKLLSLTWAGVDLFFVQPVSGLIHAWIRGQAPQITNDADAMVTLLALAVTLGVSAMSWRWFERPIVLAGQRVSYR